MKKIYYPAVFHPEEIGYSVTVPDIPGCFTQGDTLQEAVEMASDAIGLCFSDVKLIRAGEAHVAELSARTGIPVFRLLNALSSLETKGLAVRLGGNRFSAV